MPRDAEQGRPGADARKGRVDEARGEQPALGLQAVPVSLPSRPLEGERLRCADSPSFVLYPKWRLWGLKGEAFSDLFITGVKAETIKIDGSPQTLFMNI